MGFTNPHQAEMGWGVRLAITIYDCLPNYGSDPRSQGLNCKACGEFGRKACSSTMEGDYKPVIKQVNLLVPPPEKDIGKCQWITHEKEAGWLKYK